MAKVLEGPGMGLMRKWGMDVPHFVVITSVDQLEHLSHANTWLREKKLVVKAHEAIGSRMKLGLVKVNVDLANAKEETARMLGKTVGGLPISQVIVSEMIDHDAEYYLAVKSTRDGAEVLMAAFGGIEVEANWEKIRRVSIEMGADPKPAAFQKLADDAGFKTDMAKKMAEAAAKLYECFDQEDATYLEINPIVPRKPDNVLVALDSVTMLDADARFRHPDWSFTFAAEFGRPYTEPEREIMEIDSRIKGSVKFIEIPGGDTAMLPAGGGASVYYSDAVVALDGKLANYAEYSGDPPDWAVEALTYQVCSLPGIKRIVVGGAIANFTNVKKTFAGIINGFREAKAKGKMKGVEIWVRRGGPYEKEGLAAMKELANEGFNIHVFDRYTPLTDIVDFALKGGAKS